MPRDMDAVAAMQNVAAEKIGAVIAAMIPARRDKRCDSPLTSVFSTVLAAAATDHICFHRLQGRV